jgi:hypothetical protein
VDDVIVSIEGEPAGTSRREIQRAIQRGGPVKTVVIERAGAQLETRLDWSAEPAELERERRAAERAAQKRE